MADTNDAARAARYSTGAIALHWLIAAAMVFQLALGLTMGEGHSASSFARFQLHKSVGITILLLTLLRIGWRLVNRPPLSAIGGWEGRLAKIVHVLFYVLLLVVPLSGWAVVSASPTRIPTILYGVVPWPDLPGLTGARAIGGAAGEVHELLSWVAIVAILLHVAGALKHQLLDRDLTFARMAPGAGRGIDGRLVAALAGVAVVALAGVLVQPRIPAAKPSAAAVAADNDAGAPPVPAAPTPVASEAPAATPTPEPSPSATPDAAAAGALAQWKVQPGGRLGFTASWSGEPVAGTFTSWDADIRFGTAALDKSRVKVTIRTGSAKTGQEQPDSTLPGDDWFATGMFPTATFEATRFTAAGPDRYVAAGTLTIRGKSHPLSLPFTLKIDGDTAKMTASASIDRTAYGVGFAGTDEVAAQVKLDVKLTAKRGK